jgi:acetylornithine deacetylase
VEFAEGRPSLVAWAPGTPDEPRVVLAGHVDTVAVDGYPDAFAGRRARSRVYGRGACDMKAAIACYVEVAEVLAHAGHEHLGKRLAIAAVADEEHRQRGAKAVRPAITGAEVVVIGEPTELQVCTAAKGLAAFTLRVDGEATHGSVPQAGTNAIERAAELIHAVRAHADELAVRRHPLLGPPVLNIGVIRGGSRANVVPPRCEIEISRRLLPGEVAESAQRELARAIAGRCGEGDWELSESWWTVDPYENTGETAESFRRAALREGIGDGVGGFPASSDAAYFGPPVIICGPGSLKQAHSLDEWVDVDELVAATRLYLRFISDRLDLHGGERETRA